MDRAFGQRGEHALIAIDDALDGIIIGKHGEDDFAPTSLTHRRSDLGALRGKRFGSRAGPVVSSKVVARFQ